MQILLSMVLDLGPAIIQGACSSISQALAHYYQSVKMVIQNIRS